MTDKRSGAERGPQLHLLGLDVKARRLTLNTQSGSSPYRTASRAFLGDDVVSTRARSTSPAMSGGPSAAGVNGTLAIHSFADVRVSGSLRSGSHSGLRIASRRWMAS